MLSACPPPTSPDLDRDAWSTVVGQPAAVAALRGAVASPVHAWLFVGPSGAGGRSAARAFAAELFAAGATPEEAARHRRLAVAEQHPDLHVVERTGAAIPIEAAREIVRRASLSPAEGDRKVMVLDEFHLVSPAAAATLLKTIEEPPPGTFFVVLADEVTPDLVTIASRCARVDFPPLSDDTVRDALVAEGADPSRAAEAAAAAHGALDRARLLVADDRLALRVRLWREIPSRLDGTGHARRRAGRRDPRRHRRRGGAARRGAGPRGGRGQRADRALRPAGVGRPRPRGPPPAGAAPPAHRRAAARLRGAGRPLPVRAGVHRRSRRRSSSGLQALQRAIEALIRNPSEELLLQSLLLQLPRLG